MEIDEKSEKLKIDENNQSPEYTSNSNNIINPKIDQIKYNNLNKQLKLGEFMLTPLEGIILNKKMPFGFKLETEENILKSNEQIKNLNKKFIPSDKHKEHNRHPKLVKNTINEDKKIDLIKEHSNNNNKKIKKIVPKENSSSMNISNSSESYKIRMKCLSGFNKIKSNPISKIFYFSKFPDSPSLSLIEKKIKNFEYKSINDFCEGLRKLWNYQFKNYARDPNVYQNICKMSLLSDQICKELSNENVIENKNKNEEYSNIKKRTDKIKKDLNELKVNNMNEVQNKNFKQKEIDDKGKINYLGQLIRKLNLPQLKGIVSILSDKNQATNNKVFEFDLDKLPFEKFKKLEEYVLNCINNNKNLNNNNVKNINNGINKNINKSANKTNKNINELKEKEKKINKKINNSNNSTINKNSNLKKKNIDNQNENNKMEKKSIIDKKSLSDSNSYSSDSSLSN